MALIKCPECGTEVSSYAKECPKCACPVEMFEKIKLEQRKTLKAGQIIDFGNYPQTEDGNDQTPIEWRVLAIEGNKALIISEYALDCKPYNTTYTNVTWETCTLREWLNGTFLNAALSTGEQAKIQSSKVTAEDNPDSDYGTEAGNDTTDKVFLLSISEAEKYFSSDEDRKCVPTAYVIAQGAWTDSRCTKGGKATCCWWLRSPGGGQNDASEVALDGSVDFAGTFVEIDLNGVRPALWISLDD